jgi:putative intracellular protease/amidase
MLRPPSLPLRTATVTRSSRARRCVSPFHPFSHQKLTLPSSHKVTCFSDSEETAAGLVQEIPFLVEKRLREEGATFVNERQDWGEEVVVDGQLITGGNPASAAAVGKALVAALKK